jgi:alpha-glucosidase
MADLQNLLSEAHRRDLKVLIDLVVNHTSNLHAWFADSRSSKTSLKRDWYVWRDADPDGEPPNNWRSAFGGPAWQFDEPTGQYYLHSFLPEQPDLNWGNPEVRAAMCSVMRYWLDLGVDGFRADAVSYVSKDPDFGNDPIDPATDKLLPMNSQFGPNLYEYLGEMASVLKEYDGRFMVTEAYADELGSEARYYRQFYKYVDPSVVAPFNFESITHPWQAEAYGGFIAEFESEIPAAAIPVYAFGNHDNSRVASRLGPAAARAVAVLQMTLPGMPVVYYGDELGMLDGNLDQIGNFGHKPKDAVRFPARTPMLWDDSPGAGFTSSVEPWLPVNSNYKTQNVEAQLQNDGSFLALYRQLIELRRGSQTLRSGKFTRLKLDNPSVLSFKRILGDESVVVFVNFTDQAQQVDTTTSGTLLFSTELASKFITTSELQPNEAIVILEDSYLLS